MRSSTSKRRRSFWFWFGKSKPSGRIEKRLSHRRLVQEPLESRMLLSVSPTRIALDSAVVADPRDFVQIGDVCYFTAQDSSHGRELWVTDGTQDGTQLVKDI
ncbi:MAG: hypothetical protein GX621_07645, partial [Pirellulaceae bacterium]|nr:hypothetical protein [Pirellulaceae bacterium]